MVVFFFFFFFFFFGGGGVEMRGMGVGGREGCVCMGRAAI